MGKIPKRYLKFMEQYPDVGAAYKSLGDAAMRAGPLDEKSRALAKLAISVGARMEGAVHSHTRQSLEAGASAAEVRHVVLLSTTTVGFPNMMTAMSWVDDVLDEA